MRAHLYIVKSKKGWQAYATIAPLVDWYYWHSHKQFLGKATTTQQEFTALEVENGQLLMGWLAAKQLPLGQAYRVVYLFNSASLNLFKNRNNREGNLNGKLNTNRNFNNGYVFGIETDTVACERLRRIIEEVQQASRMTGNEKRKNISYAAKSSRATSYDEWKKRHLVMSESSDGREAVQLLSLVALRGEERAWSEGELTHIAKLAQQASQLLAGRALLIAEAQALIGGLPGAAGWMTEAIQLAALHGQLRLGGSVAAADGRQAAELLRCQRCGSGEAHLHRTACAACGESDCAYCEHCLTMGRSRQCALLIRGAAQSAADRALSLRSAGQLARTEQARLERWGLSAAQTAAARAALRFIEGRAEDAKQSNAPATNSLEQERTSKGPWGLTKWLARVQASEKKEHRYPRFLIWAVTGAGKTEMVFPLVESTLLQGGKVLLATPRRDVVIELDPRIRKAFPNHEVVTLYGGSEQRWENGDITLATTHQLMRFEQSFDLVIIDELDAFPYVNDETLHYAAAKSGKPAAVRIFLSATPPQHLQKEARSGVLPHAKVPVRYHRHPLPVPHVLAAKKVAEILASGKLPSKLLKALHHSWKRGAQLFVFVQRIEQTEPFAELLKRQLRQTAIAATSSKDEKRAEKVKAFRQREIRLLVTTTILERGVTIPQSDVYIMDADGSLFDEASLVQMAGRAGRSADDPFGQVYFCASHYNQSQQRAIKHIRIMNRIARQQGYLKTKEEGGS